MFKMSGDFNRNRLKKSIREELFKRQEGRCPICLKALDINNMKLTQIDHDRTSIPELNTIPRLKKGLGMNLVRGLLCNRCNMGLGMFSDSIDSLLRAAEYLRRYQRKEVI